MKVALVLTGLARAWEMAYPSFKQYVLDRYETDVYIDIWSEIGWYSGKGYLPSDGPYIKTIDGERGFHASGEQVDANRLLEVYNPISLRISDYNKHERQFEDESKLYPNALTRPKNTLAQAFLIEKALRTIEYDKYDIIIRSRPDIVLEHDPGLFSPDEFLTLPSRNSRGQGTGDSIQIGNPDDIFAYADMTHIIPELYETIGYSCPHAYAEETISYFGIENWKEMNIGAHVVHSPSGIPYQEPE